VVRTGVRWQRLTGPVVLLSFVVVCAAALATVPLVERPGEAAGAAIERLVATTPAPRTAAAYEGLGAWVDAFDYAPAYQGEGRRPALTPAVVDDMAAHGVRTVFVQAARADPRSPGGVVDAELLAALLVRAHRAGVRVVAWYLPTFANVATDLANLARLASFTVLGHRFDGLAVDIELTEAVPDHAERNARLVALSEELRREVGSDALGAIVLPPVQIEVVNPTLWPDFPWRALAPIYDVWLPMSYWTFRSDASGYRDPYAYNEESTRRLRANLGDDRAAVHGIGGIGDLTTAADIERFATSLRETASLGGSIYDWATSSPSLRSVMASRLATTSTPGG
jgi:hypothetical protein